MFTGETHTSTVSDQVAAALSWLHWLSLVSRRQGNLLSNPRSACVWVIHQAYYWHVNTGLHWWASYQKHLPQHTTSLPMPQEATSDSPVSRLCPTITCPRHFGKHRVFLLHFSNRLELFLLLTEEGKLTLEVIQLTYFVRVLLRKTETIWSLRQEYLLYKRKPLPRNTVQNCPWSEKSTPTSESLNKGSGISPPNIKMHTSN